MTRWEYMRTSDMNGDEMWRHGYVGWELVAVVQRVTAHNYPAPDLYWKRPVPAENSASLSSEASASVATRDDPNPIPILPVESLK